MFSENIFTKFHIVFTSNNCYNITIKKERKLVNKMKEYTIEVYNVYTNEVVDLFIAEFTCVGELKDFMDNELHYYNEPYYKLSYVFHDK